MTDQYTHGTNPIFLIDKIVRTKIYSSAYYKEKCFALDAKTIIDRAIELKSIGGTFGGTKKPAPFLCLLLKLLQIYPDRAIIESYIQSDFKYLRALGCMYLRLVGKPEDIYSTLEPIYNDYRKLTMRSSDGSLIKTHMDEYVDDLLHKDVILETVLPKITKRHILEENQKFPLRVSVLDNEIQFEDHHFDASETPQVEIIRKKPKLGEGGKNPQKEPAPESTEYWNNIRKQLGLRPLKENI
jgi:pre-mRNA-splicing factor 38A